MYRQELYTPPTLPEYAEAVAECLGHIPTDAVIHRITGDCPRDMLVAPEWNKDKNKVISKITEYMQLNGIQQGSLIGE